jgi:HEAT repeat protein
MERMAVHHSDQEPMTINDDTIPKPALKQGRRFQTGVITLVVLVAVCGILSWSARSLLENQHPVLDAARRLKAPTTAERVLAIHVLAQMGIGDNAIAITALIPVLSDSKGEVRQAACESLSPLVTDAIRAGSSALEVRAAITALIGSLKDPVPAVRAAALWALGAAISSKGPAELIDVDGLFAPLTEALGDEHTEVRIAALDALGRAAAN